jgi:DNA-binding LytR/AlgR family response regulator
MERIIIIDDNYCKKELADFIEANKEHIRFSTSTNDIKSASGGLIEEITSELGSEKKLAVFSNQHIEIIHTRDITHLEAIGQRTKINFADFRFIETTSNLNSFSNRLKGSTFLKVHDNFIVNLDFFSKLNINDGQTIELSNGIHLPIDEAKKALLIKYLENEDK